MPSQMCPCGVRHAARRVHHSPTVCYCRYHDSAACSICLDVEVMLSGLEYLLRLTAGEPDAWEEGGMDSDSDC